jgi:predicted AAA+ superfamily ATPase
MNRYFIDVGLACYLLGMESPHQVERDPLYGSLFENMVIMELVTARAARGQSPNLNFYRASHGNEIDVLTEVARILTPIEIKTSGTFQAGLIKSLNFYMSSTDRDCRRSYLIYAGSSRVISDVCKGLNFVDAAKALSPNHG